MAASQGGGGGGGPVHPSHLYPNGPHYNTGTVHHHTARSLDRALEEAVSTGVLNLSGRKLRDFPGNGYDLTDTTQADLSKNRFMEIPPEVCLFAPLETLNLYHNCIKAIPEAIVNLQMLTYLNIVRQVILTFQVFENSLPVEVLTIHVNKMVSAPELLGMLRGLFQLDLSCNELQVLPQHIGKLYSLKELNVRRNNLRVMPEELADLPLVKLDFSCNKVTEIPISYIKLRYLQVIVLDNNPMQSPPPQVCLKGKVHIFKFLNIQACRMDKKPGSLDLPTLDKRNASQPLTDSIEDFYPNKSHGPDSGIGSDNGDKRLSTTEPSDDDTISLHSQVSESRDQGPLKSDSHIPGCKLESHKDQEPYDFIDNTAEDTPLSEHGDAPPGGPLVSYLKERGKQLEKSPRGEEVEDWGDQPSFQQKKQLAEEEEDELKGVTDLRKIAAQLLQQEKQNRLLNHSYSVNSRDKTKQTTGSDRSGSADEVNSPLSPYDSQDFPPTFADEDVPAMKYKSSRKSSSGNENEQNDDSSCISPQSPVFPEDGDRMSDASSLAPFGLKPRSAFSRQHRQDYGSLDPGFTMRRKMEHLREEMEQMQQLRCNIESRLKVDLPEDIGGALMDGVVLCHLANHIRPRSVSSIHVPSPAVPKLSMAKCRRNVENFLEACKKLGVPQEKLCLPHHILEERGLVKVGITVQALLELPASKTSQLSAV
ncbi:leucine-rich repeat and calponin homology domain-containing protein 2 [Protopterus annectens]|uniref:leucine-rich repeat and calponin homology domain-containing protein 2 n=1 Tax=Protopterus annectens TaxID=7888 RepID=UPI001CFB3B7A|nr:leucine-rich repeat and calponin homology domain-containing protein 2 [Protopterus annectens]